MRFVIAGGTGLIGRQLYVALAKEGHEVTVLSRSEANAQRVLGKKATVMEWDAKNLAGLTSTVEGTDGIVNLVGESIGAGRWTSVQKERILSSRVGATRALVSAMGQCGQKPKVLVNGSAVGYYGDTGDAIVTENAPASSDFLGTLCQKWEAEAQRAEEFGVRVVRLRTGIVLGKDAQALRRMMIPFKLFVGGPIGSGRQWISWIHQNDEIGIIRFALTNVSVEGPVNSTAPEPVTNREFSKILARALHRPSWAPVPGFIPKLVFGEMAQSLLLTGQRVLPEKIMRLGYPFQFPRLQAALEHILK